MIKLKYRNSQRLLEKNIVHYKKLSLVLSLPEKMVYYLKS